MYFIHPDFTTSSPSTWRVVNKHFFLSKISTYAREIKLRYFFSSCQWHSPALRYHFLTEASFIVLENMNRKASANYKSTGNNQMQGRGNLSDSGLLHFSLKEQQPWGMSGLGTCIMKLVSLALAFRRGSEMSDLIPPGIATA